MICYITLELIQLNFLEFACSSHLTTLVCRGATEHPWDLTVGRAHFSSSRETFSCKPSRLNDIIRPGSSIFLPFSLHIVFLRASICLSVFRHWVCVPRGRKGETFLWGCSVYLGRKALPRVSHSTHWPAPSAEAVLCCKGVQRIERFPPSLHGRESHGGKGVRTSAEWALQVDPGFVRPDEARCPQRKKWSYKHQLGKAPFIRSLGQGNKWI